MYLEKVFRKISLKSGLANAGERFNLDAILQCKITIDGELRFVH